MTARPIPCSLSRTGAGWRFGADDTKNRTRAEIDAAWRDLPGLVVVGEREVDPRTGEVGWLVLPADAARAIGATGDDDGGEE